MDRWKGTVAAFAAIVMVGGASACADWPPPELVAGPGNDGDTDADDVGDGDFRGKVIARTGLNIRRSPTTKSSVVGGLASGSSIRFDCKVNGQNIEGNPRWYRLSNGRWVTARYVTNVGAAPRWCD